MRVPTAKPIAWLLIAAASAPAAAAAPAAHAIDIPAGPLAQSLERLAAQTGISVGTTGPLPAVRAPAVRGRMSVETALRRLLAPARLEAVSVGPNTWRLRPKQQTAPPPRIVAAAAPQDEPAADIVVTASKQGTPLSAYPGSVVRFDLTDSTAAPRGDTDASAALVAGGSSLSSTNLGPGRNKLFVRGVADSSFNGPTPATVAQYFGEARLNFAAPDPNLNLYDVANVEILEGPQGTLYGSAAIGGIVRLLPNAPVLDETSGTAEAGLLHTGKGDFGGDGAAMLNLPLGERAAVRAVGYGVRNPGYIDDIGRGVPDANRTLSYGGRVALRFDPSPAVSIEVGGIYQDLESKDGQYAELGLPPLTHSTVVAQPFDNDFRLAYVTVKAPLFGASLTSSTGFVRQELGTTFDATPRFTVPSAFVEDLGFSVLSHESRITGGDPSHTHWLLGLSGLLSFTTARRQLGPVDQLVEIAGVRNAEREAALFGEGTVPLLRHLSLTLGARVSYDEASGRLLSVPKDPETEPKRRNWRFLPKAAIAWQPGHRWLIFAHYQEGFRPGGLSITGPTTAQKFQSDTVWTLEGGVRFNDPAHDRLSASVTVSRTRWQRIQADLIDANGLPFTTNIGSGRVNNLEAELNWRLSRAVSVEAGLFLNQADLDDLQTGTGELLDRNFPNIADAGGRAAIRYDKDLTGTLTLNAQASLRYSGRSFLGALPPLDLPQGDYILAAANARIGTRTRGLRLSVDNLFNVRANRFAYGNPFSVERGNQITPLRPRTIRVGFDARF
jgi:outer membrane receptor protein involved in Fe transport